MTDLKSEEYIEISLSKIVSLVFKNIKLFSFVLIIGLIFTVFFTYILQPKYICTQLIQVPHYTYTKKDVDLVNSDLVYNLVDYLKAKNPQYKNISLKKLPSKEEESKSYLYQISIVFKDEDSCNLSQFDSFLYNLSNSDIVKYKIDEWKKDIHSKMRILKVYTFGSFANSNDVDSFSKLEFLLQSLQPNFTKLGYLSCKFTSSKKMFKAKIFIGGFIFTIILSFIVILLKVILKEAFLKYKSDKQK
ncbi:MAG: Wzz/FepE/Etk N-terminal domain-containing protein [Francisella sp.]